MKTTGWTKVWFLAALFGASAGSLLAADPAARKEEERKLLAVLSSDAPLFDKAKACQRLAVVGTAEAVPALAALLPDERLSHYARYALEPIPDPSVDSVLREAAFGPGASKLKPEILIGIVNSIGARRDKLAEGGLVELLASANPEIVAAAAEALGRLATPRASEALGKLLGSGFGTLDEPEKRKLRAAVGQACVLCAEGLAARGAKEDAVQMYGLVRRTLGFEEHVAHVTLAATRGLIVTRGRDGLPQLLEELESENPDRFLLALGVSRELPYPEVTSAFVERLSKMPPEREARLLCALGDRGDKKALPAVSARLKSSDPAVRQAAVRAMKTLGDASVVPMLLETAAGPDAAAAEAAFETLCTLEGRDVDEILIRLVEESEPRLRPLVLQIAGKRRMAGAIPALKRAARSQDAKVRRAALAALGSAAGLEDLEFLVETAIRPAMPEEREDAREALRAACRRAPDREACADRLVAAMEKAPLEGKALLLEALAAVGGPRALEAALEKARAGDAGVREAAVKALGEWPSEDAAPKLLELIRSSSGTDDRLRAFRALSSVVRRLGFPSREERLAVCKQAGELARDAGERRVVIEALSGIPAPESLAMLKDYLADQDLVEDACRAMVTISERLVRARAEAVREPMELVLRTTKDRELAARAEKVLEQAKGARR